MTAQILPMIQPADSFKEFWDLCHPHRKKDKATARKKFIAITSGDGLHTTMVDRTTGERFSINWKATAEELILAHKAHRMQIVIQDIEGQYVPMVSTWLNRGGWDDLDPKETKVLADRWDRNVAAGERLKARGK